MAKLVAHLNARPISTRFHIRVATVRAVHVMREPARINLPAGARRASTVKLAHLTVFGCLKARLPRPMRRRAMSALAPALPLGIGSWPRRRMDWGDSAKYRQLAEAAEDPLVKQELLDLAAVCEEVANNIDDRLPSG